MHPEMLGTSQGPCLPTGPCARRFPTIAVPGMAGPKATFAINDSRFGTFVVKHFPAWVLITGLVVVPTAENRPGLNEQTPNVPHYSGVREALQLALDNCLQFIGVDHCFDSPRSPSQTRLSPIQRLPA
jgi:hypothetical protein